MAYNGSGTFNRLYNWQVDRDAAVKIRADKMDAEMDGFATGLTTALTKDGQTTPTANLPMGTFKHTGVGDGSALTHYASVGQLQKNLAGWAAAGGTADAITCTFTPTLTSLTDGMIVGIRASGANTVVAPTFLPDGVGLALTITKAGGQALVAGDIFGAGHEILLRYRNSATRWELLNPASLPGTSGHRVPFLDGVNTWSGANTFADILTMTAKSIYQAEGATVASGTAPSASAIWAGDGDTIHMSGTTTQTGFAAAPQAGAWKRIILDGAISFTHSANLNCQGGVDFVGAAGDLVLVYADTTTQFDLYFFKASGLPIVAPTVTISNDQLLFQDQAANNSAGPSYASGAWRTVSLDTEVTDTAGIGSVASNQITLAAGSYEFWATIQAGLGASDGYARARLYNITDSSVVVQGVNSQMDASAYNLVEVHVMGSFVIASQKTFELQVYPTATCNAGAAVNTGEVEVYASLRLRRYAA